uniref:GH16 domain-containing protein n=1 Tax=Grammatophora oceanica TaxID=210454 RepID=A0A7S1Y465_9STRA
MGRVCVLANEERPGKAFPVIDERDHCFGAPETGRSNYNCAVHSTIIEGGRRLCSCFSQERATQKGDSGNVPALFLPVPPTAAPVKSPSSMGDSPHIPEGFALSWRDDFGGQVLNTTNWSRGLVYDKDPSEHVIWNKEEGGPHLLNSKYDGYIVDEDSYVEKGKLMLANRQLTKDAAIKGTGPKGTFRFTSGWINSLHKRYFNGSSKSVYLEVRANFPSGPKVWPAIWTVAEEHVWPPEIDIWEYFGKFFKSSKRLDEMHLRNIWGYFKDSQSHVTAIEGFKTTYDGYLTLGWMWTNRKMVWYINGVEVGRKVKGGDIPWGWPDQDMCLILNNGLMTDVDPTDTVFPNYLMIDYIAVYEENTRTDEVTPSIILPNEPTATPAVAMDDDSVDNNNAPANNNPAVLVSTTERPFSGDNSLTAEADDIPTAFPTTDFFKDGDGNAPTAILDDATSGAATSQVSSCLLPLGTTLMMLMVTVVLLGTF